MPVTWEVLLLRSERFRINVGVCTQRYVTHKAARTLGAYSSGDAWCYQLCTGEVFHGGTKRIINGKDVYVGQSFQAATWTDGDRIGVQMEISSTQDVTTCTIFFTRNGELLSTKPAFCDIVLEEGVTLCPVVDLADGADRVQLIPAASIMVDSGQ